jgi:hypothetical protein
MQFIAALYLQIAFEYNIHITYPLRKLNVHGDWSQVPTKTASTNRPPDS